MKVEYKLSDQGMQDYFLYTTSTFLFCCPKSIRDKKLELTKTFKIRILAIIGNTVICQT